MIPDPSHYLICLALGILVNHLLARKMLSQKEQGKEKYLIALLMLLAFFVSLHWNFLGFILTAAFSTALVSAISIPIYAVAVTLILYVCRPWEVVEANEWWLQIPRWCIWIWLLSWFRKMAEIGSHSFQIFMATRGFLLIFVMGLWAGFTIAFSGDPATSLQYYIDTLFRALFLVFVIGLTVREQRDVRFLCSAFAIGVATLSIFSLWRFQGFDQPIEMPFIVRDEKPADRRLEAVGSLGNSNDIAAVVMIPLGFLWPILFSRKTNIIRWAFAAAICFLLLKTIMASQSRGALIAGVAQCGIYFVSRARRPGRLAFIIVTGVGILSPLANRVMGRDADDLDASTESRMNYYVTGLRMTLYSPVWGQGFGRYPYEFERFSTATLHEWGLRTAHSSWILVLSETGIVGFVIFTAIYLRMFRICWDLREQYPGLLLALTGYSITIIFLSHTWLMFPWILFALIEAAKITNEREQNNEGHRCP